LTTSVRGIASGSEARSLAGLWLLAVVCAAVLQPLWVRAAAFSPDCPFHVLTGLPCPSCGATRAGLAFLHGDLVRAFGWNPLAAAAGLGFVGGGLLAPVWVWRGGRLPTLAGPVRRAWRWIAAVILLANWAYLIWRGV
jgi:hypothetical protein